MKKPNISAKNILSKNLPDIALLKDVKLQSRLLLAISAISSVIFALLYIFDTPPTGKAARLAATRDIDLWMAACIIVTLCSVLAYTKIQSKHPSSVAGSKASAKTSKVNKAVKPAKPKKRAE